MFREDVCFQNIVDNLYRLEGIGNCVRKCNLVFNSNNAFINENILESDKENRLNWNELIDYTSGELSQPQIQKSLFGFLQLLKCGIELSQFSNDGEGKQFLATKRKNGEQFIITDDYLLIR